MSTQAESGAPARVNLVNRKKPEFRIRKVCYCCGRVGSSPHHIIPRSEGGLPIFDNIVWLCVPCHDAVEGSSTGARERLEERRQECRRSRRPNSKTSNQPFIYPVQSESIHQAQCDDSHNWAERFVALQEPPSEESPIETVVDVVPGNDDDQGRKGAIKQMWNQGPLRRWSSTPVAGWIPYATGGYVGSYVCACCKRNVSGVYEPTWNCAACGSKKPQQREIQPASGLYGPS
jgi:HNH endonuclease